MTGPMLPAATYWAEHAWLPAGPARDVRLSVADGRFVAVTAGARPASGDVRLPGVVLPGLANTHSHAFHRALRGRTHADGGTFWTWREAMYAVAGRLDPDSYRRLATAVYAEMALAGITTVGEFHYLHHGPDGTRYGQPNVMAEALRAAAQDAGVRLTLLDTCYLAGGLTADGHLPLTGPQRRFGDRSVDDWAARAAELGEDDTTRTGAAIHSVRAVPAADLPVVVLAAAGRPLHAHLSEQAVENEVTLAHYRVSPTGLLERAGALGPDTTVVHATHLDAADIAELGARRVTVAMCPSTEADLADGVGPARRLLAAGARLSLGSDQHATTDLIAEARALELHERLVTGRRGVFTPAQLLDAATGHPSLGWPDAGRLAVGARADLVAVRLDTPRTAGATAEQVLLAAGAPDVDTVLVDGRVVVQAGRHTALGEVGPLLLAAITPLWEQR